MARRSLKKKEGPISTGRFSVEDSKMYMVVAIVCFHILPLFFVFMGEIGQQILLHIFMARLNPILIFCICFFHAVRLGFCFKFPAFTGVLSALSIVMYYGLDFEHALLSFIIYIIVYSALSFAAELAGGFTKHLIGGM